MDIYYWTLLSMIKMTFLNHKIWKQVPNNMLNANMSNGHLKAIYAKYESNLASGFREEDFQNFL